VRRFFFFPAAVWHAGLWKKENRTLRKTFLKNKILARAVEIGEHLTYN
jgi:hypothetical protein